MNQQALAGLPVGFMDSGVGGLAVLKTAVDALPHEDFLFYGDIGNAPYGSRGDEEIKALAMDAAALLAERGVKALVVACNTATSVAADALRSEISLPIVAMEPALKPASLIAQEGQVLVLATEMTLKLSKFKQLMESYGRDAVPIPAPKFVTAVEAGITDGPEITALFDETLGPYLQKPVKAVVLGCTHYTFLKPALRAYLPAPIALIDGNAGTARQLEKRLTQANLRSAGGEPDVMKRVEFFSTKPGPQTPARMRAMFQTALNQLPDR
jgi:glutamate racemase